jgi:hypothetical protein
MVEPQVNQNLGMHTCTVATLTLTLPQPRKCAVPRRKKWIGSSRYYPRQQYSALMCGKLARIIHGRNNPNSIPRDAHMHGCNPNPNPTTTAQVRGPQGSLWDGSSRYYPRLCVHLRGGTLARIIHGRNIPHSIPRDAHMHGCTPYPNPG